MRFLPVLLVLTLVPATSGCNGRQPPLPTTPSVTPESPKVPTFAQGERWNLITTLTSTTGFDACRGTADEEIGEPVDWLMVIARAGESVDLHLYLYGDPADHLLLTGTTSGDAFSAASAIQRGDLLCSGARFGYTSQTEGAGRFSADRRNLKGGHTSRVRLSSGETMSASYQWNATRVESSP